MSTELRTFTIPDLAPDEAQATLGAFLRTVEVKRVDTAYADGAWRVLIHYIDPRHKEEAKQIESAIVGALHGWRERAAMRDGRPAETLLPESAVAEIARFAPTTERELSILVAGGDIDHATYGSEIVQVVRATLDELID